MAIVRIPEKGLGASASDHLSPRFTISDLSVSDVAKKKNISNFPDAAAIANLRLLAELLELIWSRIGPFTIHSAYRSVDLQAALQSGAGGAEAAKMAVKTSYHNTGQAADLTPTTMTLQEFYVRLWNDTEVMKKIGQVAYKDTQNAVHVSVQTSKFPSATPMKVLATGEYVRLNEDEKTAWLAKVPITVGVSILTAAIVGLGVFLAIKALRENPALAKAVTARASAMTAEAT